MLPPIRPTISKLCSSSKSYKKEYGCNDSHWQNWDTHRYNANMLGHKVSYAEEATNEYLTGFRRHSHVRVSNSVHNVRIQVPAVNPVTLHSANAQFFGFV
ncbi:hypothetical protein LIER_10998 [Lithospermum erythrorhizon]|uniref:Uncharacterized protein n=1 Tax=Lithospermum erythrorhizon TaxID=34254 RepID=A0AAV3PLI3_LITER